MTQTGKNFVDINKKRYTTLMQNLPKIIGYFKAAFKDVPQQIQQQKHYKELYESHLAFASKTKTVNRYTGEIESSEYDDYLYYIADVNTTIERLQSCLRLLNLLNEVVQTQIKTEEVQEAISWQESDAYKSLNGYCADNDDDEEDATSNYKLLQQYKEKLKSVTTKCLESRDLQQYLDFIVAEKLKQQIAEKQKFHYYV